MVQQAYNILSNSSEVHNWFTNNWGSDPFSSPVNVAYDDHSVFEFFGLHANSATRYFSLTGSRTIKFYAYGFSTSVREVTASLMHELNNAAAGWRMPYYDSVKLGGNGPKGSYASERVGYGAYDAQCN
jgi:hypothetical protein